MKWCATATVISSGAESRETAKATKRKKKRLEDWQRFYAMREPESPSIGEKPNEGNSMNVEFLYSLEELSRQDEDEEPRGDANATPDPYNLSNTLGALGEFLDRKSDAKLLFVCSHGQEVVIHARDKGRCSQVGTIPDFNDVRVLDQEICTQ
jgi:hypothetical protein